MIDHLSIGVTELGRSLTFYDAALRPLGLERIETDLNSAVYAGADGRDLLVLHVSKEGAGAHRAFHIALKAPGWNAVDSFHRAGVEAGGGSAGEPGFRPEYLPDYYAAYLEDPDGHRIEAVWR